MCVLSLSSLGVLLSRKQRVGCEQRLLLPPIVSQVEPSEELHAQAKNSARPQGFGLCILYVGFFPAWGLEKSWERVCTSK